MSERRTIMLAKRSCPAPVTRRFELARSLRHAVVWALVGLATVPACRKASSGGIPRRGYIAVVGAGEQDELWQVLRPAALRCSQQLGGLPVRTFAPDQTSANQQAKLIESLRAAELRALCVQVANPEALLRTLEDLRSSGVFVVTMVHEVPSEFPFHHCGPRELEVGQAMADALVNGLGEQAVISVVRSDRDEGYLQERYRGFVAQMEKYPQIRILRTLECDGSPGQARCLIRDLLDRFSALQGMAVMEPWPFRDLDPDSPPLLPRGCKLVSVDPFPSLWKQVSNGQCYALIATEYDRMAFQAVQWCITATAGNPLQVRSYGTPTRTVWAGNLESWKLRWIQWMEPPADASPDRTRAGR
jgi:hypothetical protein